MHSRIHRASFVAVGLCLITMIGSAWATMPSTIDLTLIDNALTNRATTNSYNQKVVSNDNGIFLTYLLRTDMPGDADEIGLWRLMRSTDGGSTFNLLYEGVHGSRPPVMETDQYDNVYLAHPDWADVDRPFYFYKFSAADNYATPAISTLSGVPNGGKYAITYDQSREQFYIGTQFGRLLTVDTDGNWLGNVQLLRWPNGTEHSSPQYPLLKMDAAGNLHHAWTTTSDGLYRDIGHMMSPDGGLTWQNVGGTPIDTSSPIIPDRLGPATTVTLSDEYDTNTWLSNMLAKDGKVHFSYNATSPLNRMHYVRYDQASGSRDVDTGSSTWQGSTISLSYPYGFFATDLRYPNTPLYAVSHDTAGYGACLVSDDNGETWQDYARTDYTVSSAYSIGGASQLTDDGYIIGTFTNTVVPLGNFVMFLSIPTTLVIPHDGDADNDGDVDIFDYMTMTASYGQAGTSPWRWVEGDFDEDGDIDIFDYMALTVEYGWAEGGGGGENIPEPTTLLLITGPAGAVLLKRKRYHLKS